MPMYQKIMIITFILSHYEDHKAQNSHFCSHLLNGSCFCFCGLENCDEGLRFVLLCRNLLNIMSIRMFPVRRQVREPCHWVCPPPPFELKRRKYFLNSNILTTSIKYSHHNFESVQILQIEL